MRAALRRPCEGSAISRSCRRPRYHESLPTNRLDFERDAGPPLTLLRIRYLSRRSVAGWLDATPAGLVRYRSAEHMPDREKRDGPTPGAGRRRQRESATDRSRLGSVIAGSYRVDEFLGRGAIGAVFGGMHLRLERRVAIKFVDPTLVDDQEIRAR